eukprot:1156843-Pelagomonas_calceolata.AAC.11
MNFKGVNMCHPGPQELHPPDMWPTPKHCASLVSWSREVALLFTCKWSWGAGWEGAASALNCSFRVKVDETIRGSKSSLPHKCPLLD